MSYLGFTIVQVNNIFRIQYTQKSYIETSTLEEMERVIEGF